MTLHKELIIKKWGLYILVWILIIIAIVLQLCNYYISAVTFSLFSICLCIIGFINETIETK